MTPALSKQGLLLHLLVIGAARRTGAACLTNCMIFFMQEPESKAIKQSCLFHICRVSIVSLRTSGGRKRSGAGACLRASQLRPCPSTQTSRAGPRNRIGREREDAFPQTAHAVSCPPPLVFIGFFFFSCCAACFFQPSGTNNNGPWKSRVSLCRLSCIRHLFSERLSVAELSVRLSAIWLA